MPVSCSVVYFLCPLSMCFEFFLPFVLSHILLSREIHIQKVLEIRKHMCPGSMKRDCPSLIFAKTQLFLHFRFFFIGHGCKVVSYGYLSYLGFSSTIFRDVAHFSAIVAFWRLAWPGLRICSCHLKLPFSVVLLGFAELFFYFRCTSVPCLKLSVYASIAG